MKTLLRLVVILLLVAAVYFATQWMQLNPGTVSVVWFGYEISASIFLVVAALTVMFFTLHGLLNAISWLLNYPKKLREKSLLRSYEQGLACLTDTFSALSVNDEKQARKALAKARKHLSDAPVTLLLEAQLERDNTNPAKRQALLEKLRNEKQTAPVAERGLLEAALKEERLEDARELAESAFAKRPKDAWLALTLMDIHARQHSYNKALDTLRLARSRGLVESALADQHSAALRLAWALSSSETSLKQLQLERALKARPGFEPAVLALADVYQSLNKAGAAQRLLQRAYMSTPSRAIAERYRSSLGALNEAKQAKKLKTFALKRPDCADSQLLLAELARKEDSLGAARDFAKAALVHQERGDIFTFLAELEEAEENGSQALLWQQRAQNAPHGLVWRCDACGELHTQLHLHCPACDTFDSLAQHFPAPASIELTPAA